MDVSIHLGSPSWQVQFRHKVFYNRFAFQDASVKEKRILFRLRVIGYAASRVIVIFGVLWHRPVFFERLPIHVMTALMDSEVTIDFALRKRRAIN